MQLKEDDAELELGLAQLLQQKEEESSKKVLNQTMDS